CVDALDGLRLCRREAALMLARLTDELSRIERAVARIGYDSILETVIEIAAGEHRLVNQLQIGATQHWLAVRIHAIREIPQKIHRGPGLCDHRGTRYDPVEVPGESLRLDQSMPAAGGAAHEIRVTGRPAVEGLSHILAGDRRHVSRAETKVNLGLQIVECPQTVSLARLVPHVGHDARIPL